MKKYKELFASVLALVIFITLGNRTPVYQFLINNFPGFSYLRVTVRDWFVSIVLLSILAGYFVQKTDFKKLFFSLIFIDLIVFSTLRVWFIPDIMLSKNSRDFGKFMMADKYRYYCTSRCLSARDSLPKQINTADGYHLIILKNYKEALSKAGGFSPPKYTGNIPSTDDILAQPSAQLLGNFAIKWVISNNKLVDQNFFKRNNLGNFNLYENKLAKRRVRFKNFTDNWIKIEKDTPNIISIQTKGKADSLILADTYYPGWEVWIDSKQGTIKEEDGWARVVDLPAGNHMVEFKFKPFSHIFDNLKWKI